MVNFQWDSSAFNQAVLSINFNLEKISSILLEFTFAEWENYETFNSDYIYNQIINYRIPLLKASTTTHYIFFSCFSSLLKWKKTE